MTKFRIVGSVSREPFVHEKFAKVSVVEENNGRRAFYEVKAFSRDVMQSIGQLAVGDAVTIDGELMSEPVKDGKNEVKDARGKAIWAVGLKATSVTVGASKAPPARKPPPPPSDSDDGLPF